MRLERLKKFLLQFLWGLLMAVLFLGGRFVKMCVKNVARCNSWRSRYGGFSVVTVECVTALIVFGHKHKSVSLGQTCARLNAACVDVLCYLWIVWWWIPFSDQIHLITVRARPTTHSTPRPRLAPPRPSLILSLIFPTWEMAFVIPNDSRNKSTVMRSHWVRFFLSLKSPFTAPRCQPVPQTRTRSRIWALVNRSETDQFLPGVAPPAARMGALSFMFFFFFFQYPRLIIFWVSGAHILTSC